MKSLELLIRHVETICNGDGEYFRITDANEHPQISVVSFRNVPELGCTTGFTLGLSSVGRPGWIYSRPEFVISVNSLDLSWPLAMGEVVRRSGPAETFAFGTTVEFGVQISDESPMTSFLIYACSVLDAADVTVNLPDRKVVFSQLYPIYSEEASIVKKIGPNAFVKTVGAEIFNVTRKPLRASGLPSVA